MERDSSGGQSGTNVDLKISKILFVIVNSIIVLYAIFLILYGKFVRKKDALFIVSYNFYK